MQQRKSVGHIHIESRLSPKPQQFLHWGETKMQSWIVFRANQYITTLENIEN